MAEHNILGKKGEEIAVKFLQKADFVILEKSWRYKQKEIDIIASKDNCLVFVEVKTRTDDFWGNPEDFVSRRKQGFLIEAAENYIKTSDFDGEARFDVISILLKDGECVIEHLTNAFYP